MEMFVDTDTPLFKRVGSIIRIYKQSCLVCIATMYAETVEQYEKLEDYAMYLEWIFNLCVFNEMVQLTIDEDLFLKNVDEVFFKYKTKLYRDKSIVTARKYMCLRNIDVLNDVTDEYLRKRPDNREDILKFKDYLITLT